MLREASNLLPFRNDYNPKFLIHESNVLQLGLQLTSQCKRIFCFSSGSEVETGTHFMMIMMMMMMMMNMPIIMISKTNCLALYTDVLKLL
jgi:hypothetical protein